MILAIHTAGRDTELTLVNHEGETINKLEWESGRSLADQLLGKIESLLAAVPIKLSDITGIIVFSGPGSFTSLRIGHSVANAMADSLGIPVVGSSKDDWLVRGVQALKTAIPGRPVLPEYGAEAHITKPKA